MESEKRDEMDDLVDALDAKLDLVDTDVDRPVAGKML